MNIISDSEVNLEEIFRSAPYKFGLTKMIETSKDFEFAFAQQSGLGRLTYIHSNGNNKEQIIIELPTIEQLKTFPIQIYITKINEKTFRIDSTNKTLDQVPERFLRFYVEFLQTHFIAKKKTEVQSSLP